MRKLILTLVALLTITQIVFALPADDVLPLNNQDYFEVVHKAISGAKESIYIVMYEARYYRKYYSTPTNLLIEALADATQRGVKVIVILEQSKDFGKANSDKNYETGEVLENRGIKVYYDSLYTSTHNKLIVIDRYITIIGSTNWSYYALSKNNESNVLIKSKQVAEEFIRYFNSLLEDCK
ncbi:MAG: phospholipase D-like domain-containing protein [Candidatus Omnitrophota bacterium]